ncbi:MAG: A/G-specific adenine glycosylase [Gemmatimonadetes bacterium]|nr:A/G-specific adenine glycosylase [Gemmatimonadota bacterium]
MRRDVRSTAEDERDGIIRSALLDHFDRTARDLPWRTDRTPYRVLVSEVMLQQTRVETVVPYYHRWLLQFPDLGALARAPVDGVLKMWEGLGYYSRARNLHRTAREVCRRYGGELPSTKAELRSLPGIGEYTAGAVASIAFSRAEPAVDGNVRRVLSRLDDLEDPRASALVDRAATLVDRARPGDFNEALMELGATICRPRGPLCGECPLARACLALEAGTIAERPPPRRRRAPRSVTIDVAVLLDADDRALFVRRPPDGLLGGLWEFPERTRLPDTPLVREAGELEPVFHAFTHLHATYRPTILRAENPLDQHDPLLGPFETRWLPLSRTDGVTLPVAQQRIASAALAWLGESRGPQGA